MTSLRFYKAKTVNGQELFRHASKLNFEGTCRSVSTPPTNLSGSSPG